MKLSGQKLKITQMNNSNLDIQKLKEQLSKGLDLTFKKLVKQKQTQNGVFVLSENGQIRKIKAKDILN